MRAGLLAGCSLGADSNYSSGSRTKLEEEAGRLGFFDKPLKRNVLEGSVGQGSSDCDGQDAAFEFFQRDVNWACVTSSHVYEYRGTHGNLKSSRSHYPCLLKPRYFRRTDSDFLLLWRFLI